MVFALRLVFGSSTVVTRFSCARGGGGGGVVLYSACARVAEKTVENSVSWMLLWTHHHHHPHPHHPHHIYHRACWRRAESVNTHTREHTHKHTHACTYTRALTEEREREREQRDCARLTAFLRISSPPRHRARHPPDWCFRATEKRGFIPFGYVLLTVNKK